MDALWSRLEAASEAHKQQVQQLQEKQHNLVMQLEQRDADRSQVSEHLLQVSQEQQHLAYRDTSCSCEAKDAGLMRNRKWWHIKHCMLQLLIPAAQQRRSVHLLKGTDCFLECTAAWLI